MENIIEISTCQKCGKPYRKNKLYTVQEFWSTKSMCKDCYIKFQRSQWGYW